MRVIIIGSGLAGIISGKTIRELDRAAEILIYGEEKYPYYPRPNLIDFLGGLIPQDKVFAFAEGWQERQRLEINLGQRIVKMNPEKPSVEIEGGKEIDGDYLVLAAGAKPVVSPFAGLNKKGIFTLRTLDNALELLDFIQSGPEILVIGGGLLGLEIARALSMKGLSGVSVVEVFNRLLPRQLDEIGAKELQTKLEKMGIRFFLGKEVSQIIGNGSVNRVLFKDGQGVSAGAVIIASGVKPRTDLALTSGLKTSRGVLVDDYLRTSQSRVYAAGDVTEHRGKVYGLIPAAFDQARTLAYNLCGQNKKYEGTIPSNTLKVAGIYLTAIGMVTAEGNEYEIITKHIPESGIYKKLILKNEVVVGAIWLGTKQGVQEISRLIQSGKKVTRYKDEILEESFDFSRIFQE